MPGLAGMNGEEPLTAVRNTTQLPRLFSEKPAVLAPVSTSMGTCSEHERNGKILVLRFRCYDPNRGLQGYFPGEGGCPARSSPVVKSSGQR